MSKEKKAQDEEVQAALSSRVRSTQLFAERPAEKSEYVAHVRIAHSLRETILEDKESRFIALLGGLGSGKSTVLGLLESSGSSDTDKVKVADDDANKEMLLFTFDAWTHGGESLRRSFVQELIEWLRDQDSVKSTVPQSGSGNDEPLWSDQEDRVVRRTTKTTTTSGTSPSLFGIFLILLTIALNVSLSSAFDSEAGPFDSPLDAFLSDPYALTSSILFLAFAIVMVSLYSFQTKEKRKHAPEPSGENDDSKGSNTAFKLIDRRTDTTTVTAADRQTPSSYDVREALKTIFSDVLSAHPGRKFVIVVDNIDRLTGVAEIKAVLSLIQLLFDIRSDESGNGQWVNQFWLIAPFSEQALFNAMLDELGEQTPRHLIDKPFQVQITIPSPLYTNWRNHLKDDLVKAFTGALLDPSSTVVSVDDIDKVIELVANEAPKRSHLPKPQRGTGQPGKVNQRVTRRPRDIKRFVNDLVMLYRTRGSQELRLPALAYYVVRQIELDGSKLLTSVLQGTRDALLLPAYSIGIDPDELLDRMYMLDYGVNVSDAREYRVMYELDEAFEEGRTSVQEGTRQAQKAVDLYCDGMNQEKERNLKTILSDATQSIRVRPSMPLLLEYARVIQGLTRVETVTDELLQSFDAILAGLENISIKNTPSEKLARYINERPPAASNYLISSVLYNLPAPVSTDNSDDLSWEQWAEFAFALLTHLDGDFDDLATHLAVPGDPTEYLRIVQKIFHSRGSIELNLPRLNSDSLQPASFSVRHQDVQEKVQAFCTPSFDSKDDDVEALRTVPAVVHLIRTSEFGTIPDWPWGQVLSDVMSFLDEVSPPHIKSGLVLPETLTVMLALTQVRGGFWITGQSDAYQLLFSMLGDNRVNNPLEPQIVAAAFVFCGLRDIILDDRDGLFELVHSDQNASERAKEQILKAPNTEIRPPLIKELCEILGLGVDNFGVNYKELVRPMLVESE